MTSQEYIDTHGTTVAHFLAQDSGNKSYVVETPGGRRWLKVLDLDRTPIDDVGRLVQFYNSLQSDLVPRNWAVVELSDGTILECDWVPGDVLNSPIERRSDPNSACRRFQGLSVDQRRLVFERILDLFVELETKGVIVEDFYDGCILYDFENRGAYVCDLDHVHWGPFVLNRERQFGSSRFMAPEERRRGSRIDQRTNVYTLGATGFVLLADNQRSPEAWPLSRGQFDVVARATADSPSARYESVAQLRESWRAAGE